MFVVGTLSNFAQAWINLVPIPPLDGSHIVESFLPRRLAWQYSRLGRWGFVILIVLLATGLLGAILGPLIEWSSELAFSFYRLF